MISKGHVFNINLKQNLTLFETKYLSVKLINTQLYFVKNFLENCFEITT